METNKSKTPPKAEEKQQDNPHNDTSQAIAFRNLMNGLKNNKPSSDETNQITKNTAKQPEIVHAIDKNKSIKQTNVRKPIPADFISKKIIKPTQKVSEQMDPKTEVVMSVQRAVKPPTDKPISHKEISPNKLTSSDDIIEKESDEADLLADKKNNVILSNIDEVPIPMFKRIINKYMPHKKENTQPSISTKGGDIPPKKSSVRKIVDRVILAFLVLVLIGGIGGFAGLFYIVSQVSAKGLAEKMISKDSSVFLAADGKTVIGELGGESRENITYSQVPQSTIDAFLSIEDSRFYKHNGFDLPRFISSAFNNLRVGNFAQGGSTLTMQTIDNFVMKPQEVEMQKKGKSYTKLEQVERKIQEIWLSIQVEKELSKKDIITKYLNQINFGQNTRGIQKGAQYYFGKNVEDLNLGESAFLAGVINAPNSYNPYRGVENGVNYYKYATQRRDDTLYQMLNHGYITKTEYALTKATKLAFLVNGELDPSNDNPYKDFVRAAADEIIQKYKVDPATTPMTIYTTLDPHAQKEANKVSAGKVVNLEYNKYFQIGFTVLDNKNGEIRAISAGRTDIPSSTPTERFRFNEPHQPGSSVKPILDYAPSFDKIGYCTGRLYIDKPISIGGWKVVNSDRKYYGKVSMERAIAQSLNTPAVQTYDALLNRVGTGEMIKYNKALGFDKKTSDQVNIQYAIGASSMQASPTQMAAAYATLANQGNYTEPHMVRKFVYTDSKKTVHAKIKKQNAMSPQAAYMTSELLNKAIFGKDKGWNLMSRLGFGAYPVYGKTGTTDWGDAAAKYGGSMKDEWMVNYTSEYTIATWTGFDGGVAGGNTFISEDLLYRNIPGWINKHMLDTMATGQEKRIARPDGISSYGGGLIKTNWLSSAAKNNPLTLENTASKTDALQTAINNAKKIKPEDYTGNTFKKLLEAIAAAEKVVNDEGAAQSDIDKVLRDLQKAYSDLIPNSSKGTLQNAINDANGIDGSSYTDDSYAQLKAAIASATGVFNNPKATQSDIDAQVDALNKAKAALTTKANKDALGAAINGARALNAGSYTPDSYNAFITIVNTANAVYDNPNATQEEVDASTNSIINAQNIILKPI